MTSPVRTFRDRMTLDNIASLLPILFQWLDKWLFSVTCGQNKIVNDTFDWLLMRALYICGALITIIRLTVWWLGFDDGRVRFGSRAMQMVRANGGGPLDRTTWTGWCQAISKHGITGTRTGFNLVRICLLAAVLLLIRQFIYLVCATWS